MSVRSSAKDLAWSAYVWPKGPAGNRLQGMVIGGLESRRVRRAWDQADRILLVHTQGKVGSKAMFAALRASRRPGDAIFHTHRINPDTFAAAKPERASLAPRRTWYTAAFLGEHLRQPHDKEVVVLSAVRDPVQRSLSAFLQNVERYSDAGRPITAASRVDIDDLARQFFQHLERMAGYQWIDTELHAMFGVNFYATPFDHAAGYQVETADQLRVGVIRHDRFGDALTPFLQTMTGLDPPTVGRVNDSSSKAYADIYREMRDSMQLPTALVDELYGSPLARHFYTDAECAAATIRWSAPAAGARW